MRRWYWSAIGVLLVLAGCGSTPDIDPPAELTEISAEYYAKTLWQQKVRIRGKKTATALRPVVDGDTLYTASDRGRVVAFNTSKGRERWKRKLAMQITGGLGAVDDMLLLGTSEGEVVALEKHRGDVIWRHPVSSEVLAAPVIADGIVVVRCVDGRLFGLSVSSGEQIWMYEQSVPSLTLRGLSAPVIAERRVYIGSADGNVIALSLANGEVIWTRAIATSKGRSELDRLVDVDGNLVVRDNVVYAAAYQGTVAALAAESGRLLWNREMSSYSGLTLDEHNVYIADDRSVVRALDRTSGETVWTQEALAMRAVTTPVRYDGFVVVGDYAGYLHWLDQRDGRFVARRRVDEQGVNVAPVSVDGVLYVPGQGGTVTALKLLPTRKPAGRAGTAR